MRLGDEMAEEEYDQACSLTGPMDPGRGKSDSVLSFDSQGRDIFRKAWLSRRLKLWRS